MRARSFREFLRESEEPTPGLDAGLLIDAGLLQEVEPAYFSWRKITPNAWYRDRPDGWLRTWTGRKLPSRAVDDDFFEGLLYRDRVVHEPDELEQVLAEEGYDLESSGTVEDMMRDAPSFGPLTLRFVTGGGIEHEGKTYVFI
jgi:hypothetical protein